MKVFSLVLALALSFSSYAKKKKMISGQNVLYRPFAKTVGEKAYEYELTGSLFQTAGLYDTDGTELSLNEGESNTVMESDLYLRYGYGESLEFFGGLRFRQIGQKYTAGTNEISATNSGVESYAFGFKYGQKSSTRLSYALELEFRQSAYENTTYNSIAEIPEDEIVLGDSGSTYRFGLALSYMRTRDHYLNARVSYQQPGNQLSAEAPFEVSTAWTWDNVALNLGLDGVYSFSGDEYGSNPSAKKPQGRGVSALYNSINRQWVEPKAELFYAFNKSWRIGFGVAQRMMGQSTDKGMRYTLSLKKVSAGVSKVEKKKEKFKEYNIEATVIKISPRGKFIQIDQGLSQDVEKGKQFDIFQTDFFGGNELIATAIAFEVGAQKSILKIVKLYSNKRVKKGFVARSQ